MLSSEEVQSFVLNGNQFNPVQEQEFCNQEL